MRRLTKVVSIFSITLFLLSFLASPYKAAGQVTATLALSPSSATVGVNQNFTVNINLNTSGSPVDGVDIYFLRFNPAILQVVDSNTSQAGIQIAPGTLMPNTAYNSVNNSTGTIQFSQSTSGGSTFTGSGVLATITFRATTSGSSTVNFDFSPGSTADTNIAYQGGDRLSSVTNATITTDGTAPTVSVTSPTAGSIVTGTITVTATASDNNAVAGVQFRLDGSNLGAEDTSSPYSVSWNTSAATTGAHTLSAVARDGAGNTATSSGVSVTVASAFDFTLSNSGNRSVNQGSAVTNSITATLSAGTGQAVSFSASGMPSGVSASFTPTTCTPTCTTTLTLTALNTATVGTSTITVTATGGTLTRTTSFTLIVNSLSYQRNIAIDSLEGRSTKIVSGTLDVLNSSKALIKSFSFATNSAGIAAVTLDISPQTVFLKTKISPFLTRLLSNIDLNNNITYTFPMLFTGDLNQDNIINSVDYSVLNINWFTSSATSDLNQDGLVNSIDYSYMNKHWLITGEQ